jgi:hypothetical protein
MPREQKVAPGKFAFSGHLVALAGALKRPERSGCRDHYAAPQLIENAGVLPITAIMENIGFHNLLIYLIVYL